MLTATAIQMDFDPVCSVNDEEHRLQAAAAIRSGSSTGLDNDHCCLYLIKLGGFSLTWVGAGPETVCQCVCSLSEVLPVQVSGRPQLVSSLRLLSRLSYPILSSALGGTGADGEKRRRGEGAEVEESGGGLNLEKREQTKEPSVSRLGLKSC